MVSLWGFYPQQQYSKAIVSASQLQGASLLLCVHHIVALADIQARIERFAKCPFAHFGLCQYGAAQDDALSMPGSLYGQDGLIEMLTRYGCYLRIA